MSIITVISAQASFYYSQLVAALAGATAGGQAFVLFMLGIATIITVAAAAVGLYYSSIGIASVFKLINALWKAHKVKPSKNEAPAQEAPAQGAPAQEAPAKEAPAPQAIIYSDVRPFTLKGIVAEKKWKDAPQEQRAEWMKKVAVKYK